MKYENKSIGGDRYDRKSRVVCLLTIVVSMVLFSALVIPLILTRTYDFNSYIIDSFAPPTIEVRQNLVSSDFGFIEISNSTTLKHIRFDDALSSFNEKATGKVLSLPCIRHRHYPKDEVSSFEYFLVSRSRTNIDDQPLYEYNHMLFPLYSSSYYLSEKLLSDLTGKGREGFSDWDIVKYVGVFRVTNHCNCFGALNIGVAKNFSNYLGVALLDNDLNIISGSDIVLNINVGLGFGKKQNLQDCQLVAGPRIESNIKERDQLFLLCNSYFVPVRLVRRNPMEMLSDDSITNMYGGGLEFKFLETRFIRPSGNFLLGVVLQVGAKNLHIFEASGRFYLELWPSAPHSTREISLTLPQGKDWREYNPFPSNVFETSGIEPIPTFNAPTESLAGINQTQQPRGTACCISLTSSKFGEVYVGIAHDRTDEDRTFNSGKYSFQHSEWVSYVSHFYAFKPTPPFDIVAKSGKFCFNWPQVNETGVDNQAFAEASKIFNFKFGRQNVHRNLVLGGIHYNCPRIQFPSGIAEKVGDEDIILISVNVNDCYPRTISVPKDEISKLLFVYQTGEIFTNSS